MLRVGDEYSVWWNTGKPDTGSGAGYWAIILAVEPYRGKYKEHFDYVLKLSAPSTKRGYLKMSVKDETTEWDNNYDPDAAYRSARGDEENYDG